VLRHRFALVTSPINGPVAVRLSYSYLVLAAVVPATLSVMVCWMILLTIFCAAYCAPVEGLSVRSARYLLVVVRSSGPGAPWPKPYSRIAITLPRDSGNENKVGPFSWQLVGSMHW